MNLSDLTAAELAQIDKENTFIILPLGSVEQHGPHLPLGTKCFLSETIAFDAAARLKNDGYSIIIAPTVPFMPCHTSAGFQGCFGIGARTYSDALYEIGSSFSRDGFRNLVFVNLSISPDALKAVSVSVEDLNTLRSFRAIDPMPLWTFARNERLDAALTELGLDSGNEIHADVKETSALLHLDANLMRPEIAARLAACCVNPSWEVLKGNFSFQEMGSKEGYLGSPASANPELGRVFIDEAAFALAEAVKYAAGGNNIPELPIQIRMLLKMIDLDEM
ncbi:MAG TPA: creatininase family protein [Candidatus Rifleibacterium sp.]|nr:creatininase family protein [Candidatus Rifleibacterium sp.]HPT44817.1 creatininase family protein [Candidatus Rifleibacterium sp.]